MQRNYLQKKCLDQFTEAAQATTGALVAVRFVNQDEPAIYDDATPTDPGASRIDHSAGTSGNGTGNAPEAMTVSTLKPEIRVSEPRNLVTGLPRLPAVPGISGVPGVSGGPGRGKYSSQAGQAQIRGLTPSIPGRHTSPSSYAPDQAHTQPHRPVNRPQYLGGANESESPYDQIVISPDYSFENFVTGPGNHLAYAASVAVANQPGTAYNPLFIHGGVGLGKTHLLQAICQTILQKRPELQLCYLSCDSFMKITFSKACNPER